MTVTALGDLPVWLINLDRAADRRAAMERRLDGLGLAYTRFSAVDGRAEADRLAATVDRGAYERNTGKMLLPGKVGCYHSHLGVWRELASSDHEIGLILEDDVVFHDDFEEAVAAALSVAGQWDIVRFNCIRAKLPVTQCTVGRYRLNAYIGPFTGNGAYLIKADLARRLLPGLLPMTRPFDHELNRFFAHGYRLVGLEPWPSHVDDGGQSTITGTGFAEVKKLPFRRRLPYLRLKAANYLRRTTWLARRGMLPGSRRRRSASDA